MGATRSATGRTGAAGTVQAAEIEIRSRLANRREGRVVMVGGIYESASIRVSVF
jgi:hypothetical protein